MYCDTTTFGLYGACLPLAVYKYADISIAIPSHILADSVTRGREST